MIEERYRARRDFTRSPEPAGEGAERRTPGAARRFVVQKHAARRTHFDFRLEVGGTLKSWAVPRGPSADPGTKRLAVEVEDHPIEYGDFEGVIPEGEYGAGAVIVWDRGTYAPYGIEDSDDAIERALAEGKLEFILTGERLRGRWALVRMKGAEGERNWLLLKKRDAYADPGDPEGLVTSHLDSVVSGHGLDEREALAKLQWTGGGPRAGSKQPAARPPVDTRPMLARAAELLPAGEAWCYELKVDGVRAIGWATPAGVVRLDSRRGQRLEAAFPEVADALELLARRSGSEFIVDGEIVAAADRAPSFEDLQPRLNLTAPREIERWARARPAAFYLFDLLWLDGTDLRDLPLSERKEKLRALLKSAPQSIHYLAHDVGSPDGMLERARREGWEGVVAKRLKSRYHSGERTGDWLKHKELPEQEFLVCGWTDPQGSRAGFGALVLGYREAPGPNARILPAGRVGSGFSRADLEDIAARLTSLARDESPFERVPDDLKNGHLVRPELVAQVRFQGWTREGRLRQPVFVGLRADRSPLEVVREPTPTAAAAKGPEVRPTPELETLIETLEALEAGAGEGDLVLAGKKLRVTNLGKVLFPESGVTKGELLRYYVSLAPAILPAIEGRPLTLERYPDGISGEMFYQQRAPDPVPEGVRTEIIEVEGEKVPRLVGGDLRTLLYVVQLAAISQHVWPSRVGSLDELDYATLDLDPAEGVPFSAVRETARAVREQMDRLGLRAYPKTSGATGIHIVVPLRSGTSYETGRLLCELVARLVASAHPELATVQRVVSKRGQRVYLDFLQNRRGLTIASAYSVRPRPHATVSAPLRWDELAEEFAPEDFTVRSMQTRLDEVGDLWFACRTDTNDVREVLELL